ncbi:MULTISPECIES: NAD(P)/FAD-dependent oxidoreductase [unclassified Streptomyces]|uniref:NAD(P)/FAD-dependent oxidoreductase n=1 Tax=unclassified Streptomyces TaxID=2593676 RepID=UPI002DDAE157|nr:FAD-dependent oxidoreductase [Streptomyces sp. NBC_01237]WRZ78318.1 NAD(P)/FAD-dependent oxidoreductase [Streptomyces sp. NBC_01237]
MTRDERTVDVLIVGAGPAGLGAGAELAASGAGRVEILERELDAGGVPRHCRHGGFGRRPRGGETGDEYARRCVAAAVRAGATLRTGVTVTGWAENAPADGAHTLEITGPAGLERITARAVVLATGARERPRSARLVPGGRPSGVYTTGELQQAVHLYRQPVGTRAVVIGNEAVGHAAADTLRTAGAEVVAMVTDQPPSPAAALLRPRGRFPLLTRATVTGLTGRTALTGVTLRHEDGRTTTLRCDTVVFTGDFVPDHELARRAGLTLDRGTRGPAYDAEYRTSLPGVFAVGNLLHAVEKARVASAEGRAAAAPVLRHLAGGPPPAPRPVALAVDAPLLWIAPNRTGPAGARPLRGRFVLRTARRLERPVLVVSQDGRELDRQRLLLPAVPGRAFHLGAGWLGRVDPRGSTVRITAV